MHRHSIPGALLAMLLVFTMAACGSTGSSPSAATSAAPESEAPASGAPESAAPPSGEPIVVGSTLSLTGAFAATAGHPQDRRRAVRRAAQRSGGLLGRPVEWTLLDDESDQATRSARSTSSSSARTAST